MEPVPTKHQKRAVAYISRLTGYTHMVRQITSAPLLDYNMITLLQALMDQLQNIVSYGSFRQTTHEEQEVSSQEFSFSFGCRFCKQTGFNGFLLIKHLLQDDHQQLSNKNKKTFNHFRDSMREGFCSFLDQEREIFFANDIGERRIVMLLDFYLLTKSFLQMTTQYLNTLDRLKWKPSVAVANGVNNLLDHVIPVIAEARCIESVPAYNSLLFQFKTYEAVFSNVDSVQENSPPPPPPAVAIQSQTFVGQPLVQNHPQPRPSPQTQPMFVRPMPPPLQQSPHQPMRMLSPRAMPPMPQRFLMMAQRPPPFVVHHPPGSVAFPSHQILFNPSMPPPPPTSPQIFYQQRRPFPTPPPQMAMPMAMPNNYPPSPRVPSPPNNESMLPPLNPVQFGENMRRFLENPGLDSLVENGKLLRLFENSSTIPSELKHVVRGTVPTVKIHCFGAKVSGVGYENDYINLFVDDGTNPKLAESVERLFAVLLEFFTINSDDWVVQTQEQNGARSHLTVKNQCERVCCRITFASEIYCSNTKLIQYYTGTFPLCQELCYYVQELTRMASLEFHRLVVVVLVIFFLQTQDYLPTVYQLQTNLATEQTSPEGWVINFTPLPQAEAKYAECDSDLLAWASRFLKFYGHQMDFKRMVVCPYNGTALRREDFDVASEWNVPQERYRLYLKTTPAEVVERFNASTPMCLQDLLELKTNIAAHITESDTRKFVHLCQMAHEFYTNNPR